MEKEEIILRAEVMSAIESLHVKLDILLKGQKELRDVQEKLFFGQEQLSLSQDQLFEIQKRIFDRRERL